MQQSERWKLINLVKLGKMLRITKVRTYQNLTFTTSENINTTFYYFQKSDCAGLKRWL
ncbi:hypothetical protein AB0X53_03945 [Ligilactobacillus salivarius]|uniref:hypothetical protein n=1 Tax=Ligilactobacillus salivarius TaxID=1624 RepID=UPI003F23B5E6